MFIVGCGPARTEVSGTVRYKEELLTSGYVIVVGEDRVTHPSPISAEGSYMARGVPVGPVRFYVQDLDKDVPRGYTSPATSGLSTTLKPEPNTFDLDLQ